MTLSKRDWRRMIEHAANDNAHHDPRDWDEFDPAAMPDEARFDDDMPMDVCTFMALVG